MRFPFAVAASGLFLSLPLLAPAAVNARAVVGTVLSSGNFAVGHTAATGTATVLSGDEVETNATSTRIMLKSGSELELLPNSSSAVFENHATLDAGTVRTKLARAFYLTSRDFTVKATQPGTQAILQAAATSLTVSVPVGGADVMNSAGSKLVHLDAGSTLNFAAYDAAATASKVNEAYMLGVLDLENGHYLVRDRFTNTVSELQGSMVTPKLLHKLVLVDGNTTGTGASTLPQVDRVVNVSKISPSDATTLIPCTPDGNGGIAKIIHLDGLVNKVRTHFLLKDKDGKTYELVGEIDDKDVGTDLKARGFVLPKRQAILPAEQVVYTEKKNYVLAASPCAGALLGGALVSTGAVLLPKNDAAQVGSRAVATQISY